MENKRVNFSKVENIVMVVFALVILCLFPLITTNGFFGIQVCKLKTYLIAVLAVMAAMIVVTILIRTQDKGHRVIDQSQGEKTSFMSSFTLGEKGLIVFGALAVLSSALSEFPEGAFTGFVNGVRVGRVQGAIVLIVYIIVYFLVSRKLKVEVFLLDSFLICGSLASILAIFNGYGIDPLGFYKQVALAEQPNFISTIGNVNTFSSYVVMVLVLGIYMFTVASDNRGRAFYAINIIISSGGLIVARSDSGLFGLAIVMLAMIYYFSNDQKKLEKLLAGFFLMFFTFDVIGATNHNLDGLWSHMSRTHCWTLLIALALIGIAIMNKKKSQASLRKMVGISIGIISLILLVFVVSVNIFQLSFYGFGDSVNFLGRWGSGRGAIYATAVEIYSSFDIKSKLIGCGPDTYGLITLKYKVPYGTSTHSEYLQYLVTNGILGLGSYLIFMVDSLKKTFKENNIIGVGLGFAVLVYLIQAVFNINQILTTPIMFFLLSMMIGALKSEKTTI